VNRKTVERPAGRSMLIRYAAGFTSTMQGRLFHLMAATSLLLLLATVVAWLSSYRDWHVFAYRGQLVLLVQRLNLKFEENPEEPWARRADRIWQLSERPEYWHGVMGFGMARAEGWYNYGPLTLVTVPIWFVALLLAIPPGVWFRRWRLQSRRAQRGLCMSCGYDRRATPPEGRCPECGSVPQATPRAAA